MTYYVAKFFSRVFCLLPRSAAEFIGVILGEIFWLVVPKRRKTMARKNIMRCLNVGEDEARRVAKKSVTRFGIMAIEVLRFPVMKKNLADYILFVNEENIPASMRYEGKGGVAITSHSGNWELLGAALASLNVRTVAVGKKQKSSGADKFITEYRELMDMHVTYKTGVREMFNLLKQGWAIGLLIDQDTDKRDGIIINFLGRPTNCVTGAAALARYNDTPILPMFLHRRDDGRHEAIIHRALYVTKTKDKKADIKQTTQELNDIIAEHIRQYPEEWFWLHDRWKSIREEWHLEEE